MKEVKSSKMIGKIAFLAGYDPKSAVAMEKSLYLGVLRPFVNWAKALDNSVLVVYKSPVRKELLNHITVIHTHHMDELVRALKYNNVEVLVSDDYIPRMDLSIRIGKEINLRKLIYVQILYGVRPLMGCLSKNALDLKARIGVSVLSLIPFRLISGKYCGFLKKFDYVVAKSRFTASLLHCLYCHEAAV